MTEPTPDPTEVDPAEFELGAGSAEENAERDGDDGAQAAPDDPFDVAPVPGAINPLTGEPA